MRHAHSTYTPDELHRPLSKRGLSDAEKVAQTLMEHHIDYVISSPYKRAVQTVEGLANLIGQKVIINEHFKERKLSEHPVSDFEMAITKVWEDETFFWEGGESNVSAQRRSVKATLKLLNTYEGKNIAVGTHGNLMVLIMNYFDKRYSFDFWKQLEMPDIYKLSFLKENLKGVNKIWCR
ncbi:histidine phosphatase family protein [Evansella tamaricis]|uniref:histidine phosphatase family protein n=1 Tax=Evansella tamaricis TaxID=2069301 RepID=UPI0031B83032